MTDNPPNKNSAEKPSSLDGIQVVVRSGQKYVAQNGSRAIKDGIKNRGTDSSLVTGEVLRKPSWLRARVPGGGKFESVRNNVREHKLATVCEESKCPNIGECWTCLLYTADAAD